MMWCHDDVMSSQCDAMWWDEMRSDDVMWYVRWCSLRWTIPSNLMWLRCDMMPVWYDTNIMSWDDMRWDEMKWYHRMWFDRIIWLDVTWSDVILYQKCRVYEEYDMCIYKRIYHTYIWNHDMIAQKDPYTSRRTFFRACVFTIFLPHIWNGFIFFCGFYNVSLVPCIVLVSEMLSFTMVTKFFCFVIWKLQRFVLYEVVSKASRGSLLQQWFIWFLVFFQSNVFRKRVFFEHV